MAKGSSATDQTCSALRWYSVAPTTCVYCSTQAYSKRMLPRYRDLRWMLLTGQPRLKFSLMHAAPCTCLLPQANCQCSAVTPLRSQQTWPAVQLSAAGTACCNATPRCRTNRRRCDPPRERSACPLLHAAASCCCPVRHTSSAQSRSYHLRAPTWLGWPCAACCPYLLPLGEC